MAIDLQDIIKKGYAFLFFILAIIIDYVWGQWLFGFADGLVGDQAIIIKLMITIVLAFMTFVIPILLFTDVIRPHPLNMIYGLGALLIGIPVVMVVMDIIGMMVNMLITGVGTIIFQFSMFFLIIAFGFLVPMWTMMQSDPIKSPLTTGGE